MVHIFLNSKEMCFIGSGIAYVKTEVGKICHCYHYLHNLHLSFPKFSFHESESSLLIFPTHFYPTTQIHCFQVPLLTSLFRDMHSLGWTQTQPLRYANHPLWLKFIPQGGCLFSNCLVARNWNPLQLIQANENDHMSKAKNRNCSHALCGIGNRTWEVIYNKGNYPLHLSFSGAVCVYISSLPARFPLYL